jgi:hypothetical protein
MNVVQWLALAGGLVAAAAFTADRRDKTRADPAAVFVLAKTWRSSAPDFVLENGVVVPGQDPRRP